MEEPWYRQYFWLLVFGGIILVIAIICFVIVCFCLKQISRSLTLRRTLKQEKKQTRDQIVAVITDNSLFQPTAPPTIMLPGTPAYQYDTKAKVDFTSQVMYSTVKKEPVPRQHQQGINSAYNGRNYKAELQLPSINDRFSYTSYDSIGHITDIDYVNTDNRAKDLEYVDVLAEDDSDDDNDYDDVEII